jgi:hypothetical protein
MSDDSTRMILNSIATLTGPIATLTGKVERIEIKVDRLSADMQDVKLRLHGIETSFAAWTPSLINQAQRLDALDVRVSLIERRLDIREAGE